MPCDLVKLPDGTVAIVCSRGRRKPPACAFCGKPMAKVCDFIVARSHAGNHLTCDKPLCASCAVSGGKNVDYCPDHDIRETQPSLGAL